MGTDEFLAGGQGPRTHEFSGEMWDAGMGEADQDSGYSGPGPTLQRGYMVVGQPGRHFNLHQPSPRSTHQGVWFRLNGKQRRGPEPEGD